MKDFGRNIGRAGLTVALGLNLLVASVLLSGCSKPQPIEQASATELPPGWVFEQVEGVDGMVLMSETARLGQAYTYYQLEAQLPLDRLVTDLNSLIPAISEAALAVYAAGSQIGQILFQGVLMPAEAIFSGATGGIQDQIQGPWQIPIMQDGEFLGWQTIDRSRYPVIRAVYIVDDVNALQQEIENTQAQERGGEARDPQQMRVAFIEDNQDFAETRMEWLKTLLSFASKNLHHYPTCESFLNALRGGQTYDLIYTDTALDLDSTYFSGYKCTTAIRELEQQLGIPPAIIIGMSDLDPDDNPADYEDTYRKTGAQGFINKSAGPEAMAETTHQLLNLP
ncbi:hypothetical protein KKD62_01565 [Patescibacteria group bacterium]|nr:hypothetical protein [Patescibacteria group bacterium]MBU1931410.1 hypothetical protein [Patescibacteria group bacterium]